MRRWFLGVAVLAASLAPLPTARAQQQADNSRCQQLIFQTVSPLLQQANRFTPSGQSPQGYAPLSQPFATNPAEYALWGYPAQAYYSSYVAPNYAQQNPQTYPFGYPQSSVYPGLYPPTATGPVPALEPNPQLSSAAIWERLQRDGTFDRMSATEQADWMMRLAYLQRDEMNQRVAQANLQRDAEASVLNMRRVPFELSQQYQERSRNWRDSYTLYASSVRGLLESTCNSTTGIPPGTNLGLGSLVGISDLAAICRQTNAYGFCSTFR